MAEESNFVSFGVGECHIKVQSSEPERIKIFTGGEG